MSKKILKTTDNILNLLYLFIYFKSTELPYESKFLKILPTKKLNFDEIHIYKSSYILINQQIQYNTNDICIKDLNLYIEPYNLYNISYEQLCNIIKNFLKNKDNIKFLETKSINDLEDEIKMTKIIDDLKICDLDIKLIIKLIQNYDKDSNYIMLNQFRKENFFNKVLVIINSELVENNNEFHYFINKYDFVIKLQKYIYYIIIILLIFIGYVLFHKKLI